ncbi:MAG: thiamine diphosphokinase [Eggerthellaceae bacterium]|nr:thiamine diphosphokinase [Eggerthellaceae bacterium]
MRTCALVAAADFNDEHFRAFDARGIFGTVIAVDAGLKHLEDIGREPDIVLGDFDSLGYVPDVLHVIEFPTEKDASDLELAFEAARDAGCDRVFVYGALSGRLDHTIGNLQVSAAISDAGVSVVIVDNDCAIRFLTGPAELELPAQDAGIVSVFAMNDCVYGLSIDGLKYPLDHADISNRTTLGLSNEFIGSSARISVEAGTLAVFVPLAALI